MALRRRHNDDDAHESAEETQATLDFEGNSEAETQNVSENSEDESSTEESENDSDSEENADAAKVVVKKRRIVQQFDENHSGQPQGRYNKPH